MKMELSWELEAKKDTSQKKNKAVAIQFPNCKLSFYELNFLPN